MESRGCRRPARRPTPGSGRPPRTRRRRAFGTTRPLWRPPAGVPLPSSRADAAFGLATLGIGAARRASVRDLVLGVVAGTDEDLLPVGLVDLDGLEQVGRH